MKISIGRTRKNVEGKEENESIVEFNADCVGKRKVEKRSEFVIL